uniref:Uncharacterized protein n=1 Tax=Chromera velia CCMP2878 TaxID=1169474 RepID=A0A0K6SA70_9ALVE|eukprot:Cvel_8931.t2-p1 / transcript=Cvel_8931.t2 / gene=Cvel_8931 / organism=Chromera_velia_CCMP2878 / gene_product=hypothetical protein / transcript_product=hypothetical protein / location=Cvel_scaffold503:2627-9977(+) / protein_length=1952 / sequence_SO=supercontig / SO=protein_coding / is_pseudo=false
MYSNYTHSEFYSQDQTDLLHHSNTQSERPKRPHHASEQGPGPEAHALKETQKKGEERGAKSPAFNLKCLTDKVSACCSSFKKRTATWCSPNTERDAWKAKEEEYIQELERRQVQQDILHADLYRTYCLMVAVSQNVSSLLCMFASAEGHAAESPTAETDRLHPTNWDPQIFAHLENLASTVHELLAVHASKNQTLFDSNGKFVVPLILPSFTEREMKEDPEGVAEHLRQAVWAQEATRSRIDNAASKLGKTHTALGTMLAGLGVRITATLRHCSSFWPPPYVARSEGPFHYPSDEPQSVSALWKRNERMRNSNREAALRRINEANGSSNRTGGGECTYREGNRHKGVCGYCRPASAGADPSNPPRIDIEWVKNLGKTKDGRLLKRDSSVRRPSDTSTGLEVDPFNLDFSEGPLQGPAGGHFDDLGGARHARAMMSSSGSALALNDSGTGTFGGEVQGRQGLKERQGAFLPQHETRGGRRASTLPVTHMGNLGTRHSPSRRQSAPPVVPSVGLGLGLGIGSLGLPGLRSADIQGKSAFQQMKEEYLEGREQRMRRQKQIEEEEKEAQREREPTPFELSCAKQMMPVSEGADMKSLKFQPDRRGKSERRRRSSDLSPRGSPSDSFSGRSSDSSFSSSSPRLRSPNPELNGKKMRARKRSPGSCTSSDTDDPIIHQMRANQLALDHANAVVYDSNGLPETAFSDVVSGSEDDEQFFSDSEEERKMKERKEKEKEDKRKTRAELKDQVRILRQQMIYEREKLAEKHKKKEWDAERRSSAPALLPPADPIKVTLTPPLEEIEASAPNQQRSLEVSAEAKDSKESTDDLTEKGNTNKDPSTATPPLPGPRSDSLSGAPAEVDKDTRGNPHRVDQNGKGNASRGNSPPQYPSGRRPSSPSLLPVPGKTSVASSSSSRRLQEGTTKTETAAILNRESSQDEQRCTQLKREEENENDRSARVLSETPSVSAEKIAEKESSKSPNTTTRHASTHSPSASVLQNSGDSHTRPTRQIQRKAPLPILYSPKRSQHEKVSSPHRRRSSGSIAEEKERNVYFRPDLVANLEEREGSQQEDVREEEEEREREADRTTPLGSAPSRSPLPTGPLSIDQHLLMDGILDHVVVEEQPESSASASASSSSSPSPSPTQKRPGGRGGGQELQSSLLGPLSQQQQPPFSDARRDKEETPTPIRPVSPTASSFGDPTASLPRSTNTRRPPSLPAPLSPSSCEEGTIPPAATTTNSSLEMRSLNNGGDGQESQTFSTKENQSIPQSPDMQQRSRRMDRGNQNASESQRVDAGEKGDRPSPPLPAHKRSNRASHASQEEQTESRPLPVSLLALHHGKHHAAMHLRDSPHSNEPAPHPENPSAPPLPSWKSPHESHSDEENDSEEDSKSFSNKSTKGLVSPINGDKQKHFPQAASAASVNKSLSLQHSPPPINRGGLLPKGGGLPAETLAQRNKNNGGIGGGNAKTAEDAEPRPPSAPPKSDRPPPPGPGINESLTFRERLDAIDTGRVNDGLTSERTAQKQKKKNAAAQKKNNFWSRWRIGRKNGGDSPAAPNASDGGVREDAKEETAQVETAKSKFEQLPDDPEDEAPTGFFARLIHSFEKRVNAIDEWAKNTDIYQTTGFPTKIEHFGRIVRDLPPDRSEDTKHLPKDPRPEVRPVSQQSSSQNTNKERKEEKEENAMPRPPKSSAATPSASVSPPSSSSANKSALAPHPQRGGQPLPPHLQNHHGIPPLPSLEFPPQGSDSLLSTGRVAPASFCLSSARPQTDSERERRDATVSEDDNKRYTTPPTHVQRTPPGPGPFGGPDHWSTTPVRPQPVDAPSRQRVGSPLSDLRSSCAQPADTLTQGSSPSPLLPKPPPQEGAWTLSVPTSPYFPLGGQKPFTSLPQGERGRTEIQRQTETMDRLDDFSDQNSDYEVEFLAAPRRIEPSRKRREEEDEELLRAAAQHEGPILQSLQRN